VLILASGLAAAACVNLRPTPSPMAAERLGGGGEAARLIFLPGRWDEPGDFARRGFTAAVARRGLQVEMVAADAHMGYYLKGLFVERLREDVVRPDLDPARPRPWLVGISLGGFGALAYARHHPDEVAGVVALAPYLGDRRVADEIVAAGGLARWDPPEPVAADDFQRDLWRWLQGYARGAPDLPPVVLGYGREDSLAPAARLLAEVLPAEHVVEVPGGHDWDAWRTLWELVLDSGPLSEALRGGCSAGAWPVPPRGTGPPGNPSARRFAHS